MNMASLLRKAANFLVGVSVLKWVAADLKAEIRHDSANLRSRANALVQNSPYRAAGVAAAAGALTGIVLARRRASRTIPTRL
jgi:ElaB/YqjD/DUF883 family membrane-anchored ribosome-binding protein